MPKVLDAHTMLEHAWPYLCDVEEDIQKAMSNCRHSDLMPDMKACSALHGPIDKATMAVIKNEASVVVTPVMTFYTRQQLEAGLGDVAKALLDQLKPIKPKAIGNLWVACSVNPSRMCYEMVLAVPFSKEK